MGRPTDNGDATYLHGFSGTEQARLLGQARIAESTIFVHGDYSACKRLLEVGSGVDARTEILLRRFPDLHAACVDLNEAQLSAAREILSAQPWIDGRYRLQQADGGDLPLEARRFAAGFLCRVLEQVPSPARVLGEVRRVLAPGSPVSITEVVKLAFLLDPCSLFPCPRGGWRRGLPTPSRTRRRPAATLPPSLYHGGLSFYPNKRI